MGPNIEIPETLSESLLSTAGISQHDIDNGEYQIMAIELNALGLAGTVCGAIGNQPFDLRAMHLLEKAGVKFVVAVVDRDLRICSLAAKLTNGQAERFGNIIDENGGSLRPDVGPDGWSIFESE